MVPKEIGFANLKTCCNFFYDSHSFRFGIEQSQDYSHRCGVCYDLEVPGKWNF